MAQKPIGYYGEFRPTGVDQSAARRFEALAGLAGQVGDVAFQIGAKRAEKIGAEKGTKAGLAAAERLNKPQPEVGPPEDVAAPETEKGILASMSIESQAYNAAMQSAYLSQVSTDSKQQVERIAAQYPDDVQAFNKNIIQYRQGFIQGVSDEFKDEADATIGNYIANAETAVFKNEIIKNRELATASVNARLDGLTREVSEISTAGDRVQAETSLLEYETLIDSKLSIGEIGQDEANEQKRKARNNLESGLLKSEFSADLEASKYAEAYKTLRAFEKPESFTPQEWESFKANAAVEISRDQSIYKATTAVADQQAKKEFKSYTDSKAIGFPVSKDEEARIQAMVAGDPALEKAYVLIQEIEFFSVASVSDRARMIKEGQTGNLEDSPAFAAMVTANSKINTLAEKDAYTLGVNQGFIKPEDIIVFDPSDQSTLEQRILQAEGLSEHYGVEASPLSDSELLALTNAIPQMIPAEKIVLAKTLAIAPELWGDIAKKGGGTFAMAGATGDSDVMSKVFEGQELIDNKLVVLPKTSDYLGDFTDMVGGVYLPEDAMNVKNAALAYYATMGAEDYDPDLFEAAVTAVTGGIAEINGFKIELPRGVDPEIFQDFIDDLQPGTVAEMGGIRNHTDEQAAEIIRRSGLIGLKSGSYRIQSDQGPLENEDGSLFILTWDNELAARNKSRSITKHNNSLINPRAFRKNL